jgi:predicted dehydrogenase
MKKKEKGVSRRDFVKKTAVAAAAFTVVPRHVLGGKGYTAPSDKLNIAGIGIGNKGLDNLMGMESENIVALADVDWTYSARVFNRYPNAKKYKDYRKMFDELGKSIDAVMVATPDHTHAIAAADAMTLGKHVYVQKPLTHSVYESRLLTKLSEKYNVATQMGNQGSSIDDLNLMVEWLQNNEIGEITKIESFTNRPIWPQGLNIPKPAVVPSGLNWDLFLGPAKYRPYSPAYTPWAWRGWWDFGTGALGDMACHVLHPAFVALELNYPTKVQGSSTKLMLESAPTAEKVQMIFPERTPSKGNKMKLPEVEVNWYDGGLKPFLPKGWTDGDNIQYNGGGTIFYGTKDTLICGSFGSKPRLLSGRVPKPTNKRRRVPAITYAELRAKYNLNTPIFPDKDYMLVSHEQDWIRACKESPENRVQPASPFSEAGPFNEMVVMGVMATRLQGLNRILDWDGDNMQFTNIKDDEVLHFIKNDNFVTFTDRKPSFSKEWSEAINAKQFAAEMVRHTYRKGWKLPDMPA